jgi:hypothetical protein
VLAAGAAVVAVALGVLERRRRAGRAPDGVTLWTCACGQALRTVGSGRHQVHWVADAPEDDPILGDRCPSCGRALTAEQEHVVTAV